MYKRQLLGSVDLQLSLPDIVRRNRHRAGYHQGIAVLDLGGVRGHALEAVAADVYKRQEVLRPPIG